MIPLTRQQENLAKLLTYILCHRPDELGLVLDEEGFVPVKRLLGALSGEEGFGWVRRRHLEELALLPSPPRFELQGDRFRGLLPGPARLRRPEVTPPPLLYLAIPPKIHARVATEGLKAPAGQELLLTDNPERALKLGRRHNPQPVLVTIQAQRACRGGVDFQGYGEGLYLARNIPLEFLQIPPVPPSRETPKAEKPAPPSPPGSLMLDLPGWLEKTVPGRGKKGKRDEPAWKAGTRALRRERRRR
jgi:putative RNA 2'-phosphotransferase